MAGGKRREREGGRKSEKRGGGGEREREREREGGGGGGQVVYIPNPARARLFPGSLSVLQQLPTAIHLHSGEQVAWVGEGVQSSYRTCCL